MPDYIYEREIWIPSTVEGLDKCLDVVREVTGYFKLDFDKSFGLQTVMVESVENAIIHGNKGVRDLKVRVFIGVSLTQIIIEVEDQGAGFDLDSIPPFHPEADIRRVGGRGIYFIKSLCLRCCTLGRGNILKMELL